MFLEEAGYADCAYGRYVYYAWKGDLEAARANVDTWRERAFERMLKVYEQMHSRRPSFRIMTICSDCSSSAN
jgi:hypothetical protein